MVVTTVCARAFWQKDLQRNSVMGGGVIAALPNVSSVMAASAIIT